MNTKGNAARKDEFYPLFPEWEEVKEWAKKTFTGERIMEAGLMGVTAVILGVIFYALVAAMNNYTVTGF